MRTDVSRIAHLAQPGWHKAGELGAGKQVAFPRRNCLYYPLQLRQEDYNCIMKDNCFLYRDRK